MENAEPVSMGLIVALMIGVISFLTSLVLLFAGFVIKNVYTSIKDVRTSTSHSHQRIDELIHDNNKEHSEIRTLCMKG